MRIKLIESSGHPYNSVRKNVEKMLSSLSSDGFDFDLYRSLDKNKYETHYYGRYKGEPFTLMANTTHRALDDGDEDVFFTLYINKEIVPLGAAHSKNKNELYELLSIYFDEKENEKQAEENRKKQEEIENQERLAADAKAREAARAAEDEERKQEEAQYRAELAEDYESYVGQPLTDDVSTTEAENKIMQYKFIKQIPSIIDLLKKQGTGGNLSMSYKNDDQSKSGYIEIYKTDDGYRLENNLPSSNLKSGPVTEEQLKDVLSSQILNANSLPGLLSIRDANDETISSEFYS